MEQRNAEHELEQAEHYLHTNLLGHRPTWPPHVQEASDDVEAVMAKMLDPEQVEELREFVTTLASAGNSFFLRIGFELGRLYGWHGELTDARVCRAVQAAGGSPGRALVETLETALAQVV